MKTRYNQNKKWTLKVIKLKIRMSKHHKTRKIQILKKNKIYLDNKNIQTNYKNYNLLFKPRMRINQNLNLSQKYRKIETIKKMKKIIPFKKLKKRIRKKIIKNMK
jgi:hypothetical protein